MNGSTGPWLSLKRFVVLLIALLVCAATAVVLGDVEWGGFVATLGVALGTLSLAYFTWTVATKTEDAVNVAQAELRIAEQGVEAATRSAEVAEDTRIDSLAPLIDVEVQFDKAEYKSRDAPWTRVPQNVERGPAINAETLDLAEVKAQFVIAFRNYGRTPGYLKVEDLGGLWVDGNIELIRVPPDSTKTLVVQMFWGHNFDPRPWEARDLKLRFEVSAPTIRDRISWEGSVKLVRDYGGAGAGYQCLPAPLDLTDYRVERQRDSTGQPQLPPN